MTTDERQQESSLDEQLAQAMEEVEPVEESAEEVVEETAGEPTAEEVQDALDALEPPPKWDKRYKEVFNSWAEKDENGQPKYGNFRDWQQTVIDLYKEQQGYSTKVEQERAEARKQAEQYEKYMQEIGQVISPYRDFFQSAGAHPNQLIPQGLGLLKDLRSNPQETLMRLARENNVDLQKALSDQPWQSPESKQVEELKSELQKMRDEQAQREQRQAQMRMQAIQQQNVAEIKAFAEAQDESGNPLHPHLETVQGTMAELIYGREQLRRQNPSAPPMGLDEAYERAIRLHPDLVAEQEKERDAARLAEKAAEAKKATSAAKRVKPGTRGNEKQSLTLDQQLEAAASKLNVA